MIRGFGPPAWFLAVASLVLAFDCWGGASIVDGELRFCRWFSTERVDLHLVERVAVVRGVGLGGGAPVPRLRLRDGRQMTITPLASVRSAQVWVVAQELAAAADAKFLIPSTGRSLFRS